MELVGAEPKTARRIERSGDILADLRSQKGLKSSARFDRHRDDGANAFQSARLLAPIVQLEDLCWIARLNNQIANSSSQICSPTTNRFGAANTFHYPSPAYVKQPPLFMSAVGKQVVDFRGLFHQFHTDDLELVRGWSVRTVAG